MEGQFNTKPIKPTLDTPTSQGKQLDTNFKKEIRKTGMNLKEEKGDKHSLKKKIFKLDKMETLVHSDEFLSQKFNEIKGDDPEVIWGYHWNEVVLNSLFNDYVLNSPRYLQKYKNTRAKMKTRRGEEGIKQLQNDLEKERAATSGADTKVKQLMSGEKGEEPTEDKEKVDELFGFGNKGLGTELPMNKRSKNDTYLVDMAKKKLVAPVPYNSTPEEKQNILTQYLGQNPNIKQLSWYNAVKQGIQGVPTQVPDGSIEQMDSEIAKKYPQGTANMVSLAEEKVDETTGAAGAGAFAPALDVKKEVSETTTSASSGQYSGIAIWSKNGKPAANKPAWKGGQIVGESVINGGDYLTESTPFKKYIIKNRVIDMINECEDYAVSEAEDFQQHSERMLSKLQQYAAETPELKDDKDFQQLMTITAQRAGKKDQQSSTGTQPIQTNVSEHHLHSVEDKIAFIVQNNPKFTMDQLSVMPADEIDEIYFDTEKLIGMTENKDFSQAMYKDLKYTGNKVRDNESEDELEAQDGLFKDKWQNEEAKSKSQQRFMGMVHAAQKGELKNPSAKVAKAAENMSDKDADDFASTKHKGLPEKVKKKKVDEGLFGNSELNIDQVKSMIDNFKQSPESPEIRNQFVKAKDYIKLKTGNGIVKMPQLKIWLDQNMPQLSNYVGLLWSNWDLASKLNENKETMSINKDAYKSYLKKRINESANTYKSLNESEKKVMLQVFHEDFINESMIDDQPDSMINNQETSMVNSMDTDELNTDGQPIPNGVSGVSPTTEGYDTDDVKAKGHLADKLADYSDEEPVGDDDSATEPVQQAAPVAKDDTAFGGDRESPETISDAEKFRQALKAKYGVDNVSELSPLQRQELMKSMNFGATTPEKSAVDMDFSKFNGTDAQKAEYKARDDKRLNFLAQHANQVNDLKGYYALANKFKADTGENMFHPMAILASIEAMPKDSVQRNQLSNIENVLRSQMTKKITESLNEERKIPAILNVEKLGAENAKNFKVDSAQEDALDQSKTYPRPQPEDSIQKAAVYPNPKNFYIEQDLEKVQREAPTMESIEKAALAKHKDALDNIGNSTADGKHIPKRNLTKEEQVELALNRGDGMSDIVYDNKPSEKFEERMKKDMGDDVYAMRQKKMDYRADAPMYNKDTQPTADGDKKEENNKFKMGYNNEAVTAKYRDEFGKLKLIEFAMTTVEEVSTINEDAVKLSVDGLGNKYNLQDKKINENVGFNELVEKYDFYLTENKVVVIEKSKVIVETKIKLKGGVNESFNKMKHLMNYNAKEYVDTKKSVKF